MEPNRPQSYFTWTRADRIATKPLINGDQQKHPQTMGRKGVGMGLWRGLGEWGNGLADG